MSNLRFEGRNILARFDTRNILARRSKVARDEKSEVGEGLVEFLRSKLLPEDFSEFCRLAKIDDDAAAMDDDLPMPKTDAQAMDQARARLAMRVARTPGAESFAERFPGAARIRVG